ncbi:MAG: hypothetical protein WCL08_00205 [Verrucomicrobiota bacterium]
MRTIEFETSKEGKPDPLAPPVTTGGVSKFKNMIFKGEAWKLQKKFTQQLSWLRFFPAIKGSQYDWMIRLNVFRDKGGVTFVCPTSFDPNATDIFSVASIWLRKNNPKPLYRGAKNKDGSPNAESNPDGLKLWSTPYGAAWCIDDGEEDGSKLRLYFASLYDGSRGGTAGAAHNIVKASEERDNEPGSPTVGQAIHGDITNPAAGRLVKVERSKGDKSEFPSYSIGIGKSAAPLMPLVEKLTDAETGMIAPLEDIIYIPTQDELHAILRGYIGMSLHKDIFG